VPAGPVPSLLELQAEQPAKEAADAPAGPPFVTAQAWAVLDGATGQLLAGHKADEPRQIASTTKIMTAWTILQEVHAKPELLADRVVFSGRAHATEGSSAGLRPGESVTVDELMYGMLLPSGNDASVALGEHFGAQRDAADGADPLGRFVVAMNAGSRELGLAQSNWKNTSGLPDPENVSTAAELGQLTWQSLQNEHFRRYVGTRQFGCEVLGPGGHRRPIVWDNTNRLLDVEGYEGVKTGTTEAAGACLVAFARQDVRSRIVVVLGCPSSSARYADSRNLFRWSWSLVPQ
jgi:D-alanyl-D-alanine carboxypeptidase (penicillin-binding protein 5/6)